MNKYSCLCIIMYIVCLSRFEIFCEATCFHDLDETYFIKDGKCYCGNERKFDAKIKVPSRGGTFQEKKQVKSWLD